MELAEIKAFIKENGHPELVAEVAAVEEAGLSDRLAASILQDKITCLAWRYGWRPPELTA